MRFGKKMRAWRDVMRGNSVITAADKHHRRRGRTLVGD